MTAPRKGGVLAALVRGSAVAALGALAAGSLAAGSLAAQDIDAVALERGIQLPDSYYEMLRRDPTAFQFERALIGRFGPDRAPSFGTVRLPVVLALFADSPDPHISRDAIDASLFVGPSERGTVTDAYLEMSGGVLDVGGDVFPWVRSTLTMAQVVGSGLGSVNLMGNYFVEALTLLDGEVDWTVYDNDGPDGVPDSGDDDGYVDVVTFEYLEVAASCGGPAIWPHRWRISSRVGVPYTSDDIGISGEPILVDDYITQSVADCSGLVVQDASTIAHEFGHALGLPDYYHPTPETGGDPEFRRWVMGCWALMAGGAWGCGRIGEERGMFGPTHLMARSKHQLGWIEYLDIGEVWNEELFLEPVQTSGVALRVPLGDEGTEYFVAEYRGRIGFDEQLPADGVLMYKIDETASLRPDMASDDPYRVTMLEQDGDRGLLRTHHEGGDRGLPGDAWGVGGASSRLNADTNPALRLSNGGRTPVMVHEVYVEDGRARLVLSTGRTPRLVDPDAGFEVMRIRSFEAPVRIAGGTGPYTGLGGLPEGFSSYASGDELRVVGSLVDPTPVDLVVSVRDALGNLSNEVSLSISATTEWSVALASLLQGFLESDEAPLTEGELDYLDAIGNGNGSYDVGDLRKWLREGGAPM